MIGLVLAAGQGRRMGQPKATLVFGDRTLAWLAAETLLQAGLSRVVVAARTALELPDTVETFLVPDPDGEAIDTLRQARAWLGPGPLVVLPVDCPKVRAITVRQLMAAYEPPYTKPVYEGRGGHPVIIDLPLEGHASLRDALHHAKGHHLPVADPGILHNWNTPAAIVKE